MNQVNQEDEMNDFKTENSRFFGNSFQWVFGLATSRSVWLRNKFNNAGDIADFIGWADSIFPGIPLFRKREILWSKIIPKLSDSSLVGIEFGVAWGYSTNWWLTNHRMDALQWHGFDRFEGLPRPWRGLEAGHFDAGGRTPDITDDRVVWHVGNIEDRITDLDFQTLENNQLIVLFDFDLFEPSLIAWEFIKGALKPGDILYFDEAYDVDERRLINEYILPERDFIPIGMTPAGLAIQVR